MKVLLTTVAVLAALLSSGIAQADTEEPCVNPYGGDCDAVLPSPYGPQPQPPVVVVNPPRQPVAPPHVRSHFEAFAADHRHCVSRTEYFRSDASSTRHQLERQWEVVDSGLRRDITYVGSGLVYPRCGYDLSEAWYAATYDHGVVTSVAAWKDAGATLHGAP